MLYVLLFDVLFDLSVRQCVFLRLGSKEIIQCHPFGMSLGWGLLSQLLSLPLRSVILPRSDALPPPPCPTCVCVCFVVKRSRAILQVNLRLAYAWHIARNS